MSTYSEGGTFLMTGSEAVAEALRQANPHVACVFPITPSTPVVHGLMQYVYDGECDTVPVLVEGEHSMLAAVAGAAEAGGRVVTATSGQGIAYAYEILPIISSYHLPAVMINVTRALSGPINIHNDHSDMYAMRDTGWIQLEVQSLQEAYDTTLQAFRIAESVMQPVAVCLDGFYLSHTSGSVTILPDDQAKAFVGEYRPDWSLLNTDEPRTVGAFALPDFYMEIKRQQREKIRRVEKEVRAVAGEYAAIAGRECMRNDGLYEAYHLDDADVVVVVMGSASGVYKNAVDILREQGVKAGLLIPRLYSPFPGEYLAAELTRARAIAVVDQGDTFRSVGGPMHADVVEALHEHAVYGVTLPVVQAFVAGLGGRTINLELALATFERLQHLPSRHQNDTCALGVMYLGSQ